MASLQVVGSAAVLGSQLVDVRDDPQRDGSAPQRALRTQAEDHPEAGLLHGKSFIIGRGGCLADREILGSIPAHSILYSREPGLLKFLFTVSTLIRRMEDKNSLNCAA